MQNRTFLVLLRPIFGEKMKTAPPKEIWVPKLWSSCRDSAWKTVWTSDFGRKIRLNFGEDLFFYFWRSPVFGLKKRSNFRFWPKNPSKFRWRPFFFFFWRSPVFGLKKRSNFRFWTKNLCDSDTRTMKIRVKVACSCLTLSKKPPPFFKSWLRACYKE